MSANAEILQRWQAAVMPSYAIPRLALVRGSGATVWDADGNSYLDLVAGIAVNLLGHASPVVREAVHRQLAELGHVSNLYANGPAVALAERLLGLLDADGRVFLCNSGTEAVEAALKLARRHGGTDRPELVAATGSFHGRTLGALSVTGQPAKRTPFEPLTPDVRFVQYGDAADLRAAVSERTAAVFLEPLLGEGGVVPAPAGYLAEARHLCDAAGALLVLDEVQTGIGRTGAWFAHQADGARPDVVALAKGLGGGFPIGACVGLGAAGQLFRPGDHGSTFGGNPVACAAALAVLDTIEKDGLLEHTAVLGRNLAAGLAGTGHPMVCEVRGRGLLLALALSEPVAAAAVDAAQRAGYLINAVQPDAIRLAPPLVLTDAEAGRFVADLPAILTAATTVSGG